METELEASRTLRRQHRRNYQDNSQDDEIEGKRTFSIEEKLASPRFDEVDYVKRMNGAEFTLKFIQENGFKMPLHFKCQQGLQMRMPVEGFSVTDVKNFVGARRLVDVIDVNTQQALELTLQNWVKYFTNPDREKIYNVISLEFSHTRLQEYVESPLVVRQIDWVDTVWPQNLINEQTDSTNSMADMKYPKVRKYCLMSVGGCYTDFHVDFGGTSVWYHIIKGKKIFWLIPPTEKNLLLYEKWVLSGKQQDVFFGDQVEQCSRVFLESGDTFLIPSGWIHAVYTPDDTLVFGGNFLHSYDIKGQIRISQIEDNTKVPQKFRYPFYAEIMWYVIDKYVRLLRRDKEERIKAKKPLKKRKKTKGKAKALKKEAEDDTNIADKVPTSPEKESEPEGGQRRSSRVAKAGVRHYKDSSEDEPEPKTRRKGRKNQDEQLEVKEEKPEVNGKVQENGTEVSGNGVDSHAQEKPWVPVYLTETEIDGLRSLIDRLRTWSQAQKCVPESITDQKGLLSELEDLLELHEDDDPKLAVSGVQALTQIDPPPPRPNSPRHKTGVMMSKVGTKVGPGVRRRRTRCGHCDNCLRDDCGECRTCKDMKKFGGSGRMKQSCLKRGCTKPNLPTCVRCQECQGLSEEDNPLMECRLCSGIVHPSCMDAEDGTYRVVPDINNCWECPNCFNDEEDDGEQLASRKRKGPPSSAKSSAKKMKIEDSGKGGKRSHQRGSNSDEDESDEEYDSDESCNGTPYTRPVRRQTPEQPSSPPPPPPEVKPRYVIRPGPVEPPSETLALDNGENHLLSRSDWIDVFSYLTQPELCLCMRVCRTWNRWALEKRFWSVIDMSHKKLTPSALEGIVRRQPITLNLSWTNVTCKQLQWLLNRVPRVRELYLSGITEAAVSSLQHVNCPRIRVLGLSWSTGITDNVLRDLISPPPPTEGRVGTGDGRSRLHALSTLYLTGNDVTGNTLHLLAQYCPALRKIDLSYCPGIYDKDIDSLTRAAPAARDTVSEILLTGCGKLTDACLEFINRCPNVQRLDLRACAKISSSEIEKFVEMRRESLKIVDEKLVVSAS